MSTLKNCPCCGSSSVHHCLGDASTRMNDYVECNHCFLRAEGDHTPNSGLLVWQSRVLDANVAKLLDELENGTWLDAKGMNHDDDSVSEMAYHCGCAPAVQSKLRKLYKKVVALRKELENGSC